MPIIWHFTGLICALIGAWFLAGWPLLLIIFGLWAMSATMSDMIVDRLDAMAKRRP